jgi:hypothetical protein
MKKGKPNFVIAVNWKDRWHLPACISSIRRFYQDATITLLKDTYRGPVLTARLNKCFRVFDAPMKRSYGGGGWIKLLPAILGEESSSFRFPLMILDADTLLLGPVFEELLAVEGSLVVSPDLFAVRPTQADYLSKTYLNLERLSQFGIKPERIESFPWFNSGHYLLREPFIEPAFIQSWVDWTAKPIAKRDKVFYPLTDQSLLNHFLLLNNQVSWGVLDFADWAGDQPGWNAARQCSHFKTSKYRVLHYAGCSTIPFWEMPCWRLLLKENFAAERALGNVGSLVCSHAVQYLMHGVLNRLGEKRRDSLKCLLAGRGMDDVPSQKTAE